MRLGLILSLCGMLLLTGFVLKEPVEDNLSSNSILIFKKILNKKYEMGYHLDVAYPEVRCGNVDQGYEINKHIHQLTSGAITDFTKKVSKLFKPSNGYHYMNLDYTVHFTDNYTISVRFTKTAQFIGYKQKQPLDFSTTFNYDLVEGKMLKFKELFRDQDTYQKKMANLLWKYYKVKVDQSLLGDTTKFCMNSYFLSLYMDDKQGKTQTYQFKWAELAHLLNVENPVLLRYSQN